MTSAPDLTITVVSWNTRDLLRACLRSIPDGAQQISYEIHVVDNASTDDSVQVVREEFPQAKLFANNENFGFARANNQSWREANGRYWLLLNSDTEVKPDALDELVKFMDAHPKAAFATARLLNPDGTPQFCAQRVPNVTHTLLEGLRLHKLLSSQKRGEVLLGSYWNHSRDIEVGWTWGAALIARREAVEECGPLDESFHMYGEDLEWCLRVRRAGWQVWYCASANVLHYGGQSSKQRWDNDKHLFTMSDGVFRAVTLHRGKIYAALLHLASLLSLAIEYSRARRSEAAPALRIMRRYHRQALRKMLHAS